MIPASVARMISCRAVVPGFPDHASRGQDLVGEVEDLEPALRVGPDLGLRMKGFRVPDVRGRETVMDVTVSVPGDDLLSRLPGRPGGQVLVRDEEDLSVGERVHDLHRVGGRAADVGFGLDLGRRVDVADDRPSRDIGPSRPCSSAAVIMSAMGQPASGSGRRTVFSGARMAAVSAMKWTPQKTMVPASQPAAFRLSSRESPTKSAASWTSAAGSCGRR